jgi:hypothetical protein
MGGYVIRKSQETHTFPAGILLASIPVIGLASTAFRINRFLPLRKNS